MCDTLCVRTGDAMLFAKNSDRHPDEPQVVEWHTARAAAPAGLLSTQYLRIADADAYAFLGSRPTWLWGAEHGVNEHGVAIGNEKIWTVDRPGDQPAALLGMDIVRLGLERARSADEALEVVTALLEQHGQGGSGEPHHDEPYFSSFLIADASGGYVVETSNRTWAARPVGAGASISNRISLGRAWTRASADVGPGTDFDSYRLPSMPTVVADARLGTTRAVVERGDAVTVADLTRVLRSHGPDHTDEELPGELGAGLEGFTVCMHRRESDAQTTASMIAELRAGAPPRAWVCLGNPCTSVYVPCFTGAVPPELARTAEWQRFARLRDEVEAEPPRLAEVRRVLAEVEAHLFLRADEADTSGDPARRAEFARTAYGPVDAALHRLGV